MKKFKKFKKLSDNALIVCVIIASVGACIQPDALTGRILQDLFFLAAAIVVAAMGIFKILAKNNKKRYLKELKNALESVLK